MGGGMPMMPPGAAGGAGAGGSDSKAETKRVVPPTVKNGAQSGTHHQPADAPRSRETHCRQTGSQQARARP